MTLPETGDLGLKSTDPAPPRFRFQKSSRLIKGHEFRYMRENARGISGRFMILCQTQASDSHRRIGLVVSKRFDKHAVGRNRAKRLLREAFRLIQHELPPSTWFVVIARHQLREASLPEVMADFRRLALRHQQQQITPPPA